MCIFRFSKPAHPSTVDFRFGDVDVTDIAKTQKPPGTSSFAVLSKPSAPSRIAGSAKVDVKHRTMMVSRQPLLSAGRKLVTAPAISERLARLATSKISSCALTSGLVTGAASTPYIPKKGRFRYIDTTKMSDAELARYRLQQAATVKLTPLQK